MVRGACLQILRDQYRSRGSHIETYEPNVQYPHALGVVLPTRASVFVELLLVSDRAANKSWVFSRFLYLAFMVINIP